MDVAETFSGLTDTGVLYVLAAFYGVTALGSLASWASFHYRGTEEEPPAWIKTWLLRAAYMTALMLVVGVALAIIGTTVVLVVVIKNGLTNG